MAISLANPRWAIHSQGKVAKANLSKRGGDQQSQSQSSGGTGGEASEASDDQQREQNQSESSGNPSGKGTGKAGDPNQSGELQEGDSSTQPNENSTVEKQGRSYRVGWFSRWRCLRENPGIPER